MILLHRGQQAADWMIPHGCIFLLKGGEKVLLHFIQDSPGDHLPLEDISKALGISASVKAGQRPVVRLPMTPTQSSTIILVLYGEM